MNTATPNQSFERTRNGRPLNSNVRARKTSMVRPCSLLPRPITHAQIVADYVCHHRPLLQADLNWFAQPGTFTATIRRAALACIRGKLHPHQHRLPKSTIPAAANALVAVAHRLRGARNFSALFSVVEQTLHPIYGAGPLYAYDTALRIGARRGLLPQVVYLHAGAKAGSIQLHIITNTRHVPLTAFSAVFNTQLRAYEMENLLCVYCECL